MDRVVLITITQQLPAPSIASGSYFTKALEVTRTEVKRQQICNFTSFKRPNEIHVFFQAVLSYTSAKY
jgi:hypothetical protein